MKLKDEFLKIIRPYEEDEDDPQDFTEEVEQPKSRSSRRSRDYREDTTYRETYSQPNYHRSRVVNLQMNGSQLCYVKMNPGRYEMGADIIRHLQQGHMVVLNLQKTEEEVFRRLKDYLDGALGVVSAKMDMVADRIYIISSDAVEIIDETTRVYSDDSPLY